MQIATPIPATIKSIPPLIASRLSGYQVSGSLSKSNCSIFDVGTLTLTSSLADLRS
jgi:hypothetical protein